MPIEPEAIVPVLTLVKEATNFQSSPGENLTSTGTLVMETYPQQQESKPAPLPQQQPCNQYYYPISSPYSESGQLPLKADLKEKLEAFSLYLQEGNERRRKKRLEKNKNKQYLQETTQTSSNTDTARDELSATMLPQYNFVGNFNRQRAMPPSGSAPQPPETSAAKPGINPQFAPKFAPNH